MGSKSIRVGLYCLARSQFLNTYEHGVGIWGDIEQRECGLQQHRWNGEVGATGRWAAIASLEAPFSSVFGTRTLTRAIQPGRPRWQCSAFSGEISNVRGIFVPFS